jgi:hypothetical protein
MTTLKWLVLLLAFVLLPSPARADGFFDWLEKWSGSKMFGVGYDAHLFCASNEGRRYPLCQRLVTTRDLRSDDIRHVVDARVAYYFKYGDRFQDVPDDRAVNALKLMGMYHYHVVPWLDLGAGAGLLRVNGDGFPEPLNRAILTPLSLFIAPIKSGPLRVLTIRTETSFITKGFTGAQFGNTRTTFNTYGGEWNQSVGVGIEFLRLK